MNTIRADLFTHLFEVFPESFSEVREYRKTVQVSGPFGIEEEPDGTGKTTLAECILMTASAFELKAPGSGFRYIDRNWSTEKDRKKAIKAFRSGK